MKKTLVLLFLFSFFFKSYSQEYHKIKIDKSLDNLKKNYDRIIYVSNFIDGRTDTSIVGIVQKGLMNRKVEAVLIDGTVQYFNNLLMINQFGINMDEKMRPIIAVLNDIKVSEWTTFSSERGLLEMTIAFFEKDSSGNLISIFESEIIEENGGLSDVTGAHPTRIRDGFYKSLNKLNEYLIMPDGKSPNYSDADSQLGKIIEKAGLKIMEYPKEIGQEDNIFSCKSMRYGIYRNFEELKQNRPSITTNLILEYNDDRSRLKIKSEKNAKLIKGKFWGFSDGENIYIYSQNYQPSRHYCKIEEIGAIWAWQDSYYDANDMALQSAFGLIGLAVGNAVKEQDCIFLDPKTGLISHANPKTITKLLKNDSELIYKYENSANKRNSKFLLSLLKNYNEVH